MINTKPIELATDIIHYRVGDPESKDRLLGILGNEYVLDVGTGIIEHDGFLIHPDRVVAVTVTPPPEDREYWGNNLSITVYRPQKFIDTVSELYRSNS